MTIFRLFRHRHRPATTLIELMIYIAVLAAIGTAVFPLLFAATEDRLLQQTVALVEQNGLQMMQAIGTRVQQAERILSPSFASTGSVLALQFPDDSESPVIFGLSGGILITASHTSLENISSSQVAVTSIRFRNTSTSATHQSVEVTFTVSRTIRLQAPRTYQKWFQGVFTLFPDNVPGVSGCSCAVPGCGAGNTFVWEVCEAGSCLETQSGMQCP